MLVSFFALRLEDGRWEESPTRLAETVEDHSHPAGKANWKDLNSAVSYMLEHTIRTELVKCKTPYPTVFGGRLFSISERENSHARKASTGARVVISDR